VTTVAILLATLFSPNFHWSDNALSNLGVAETAAGTELTVVLFNGGLILGGLAGIGFGFFLALTTPATGGRVVGALFGLAMVLMGGVGVFPQDQALHLPVAMGFYLLLSIALWADAAVALGQGWRRRALAGLVSGAVNLLGWIGWASTGSVQRPGLAIPEGIGALALAVWTLWMTVGLIRGRWAGQSNA
jgi:hypothetical membrane protein